ncbi:MAG: hypothetical protein JXR07_07695 [Reichenbachiella sp.]
MASKTIAKYIIEIVVIIIGILGAFGLEAWYENNKEQKKMNKLLELVYNDLLYDIGRLQQKIPANRQNKEDSYHLLDGDYEWSERYSHLLKFQINTIKQSDRAYMELTRFSDEMEDKHYEIISKLHENHGQRNKNILVQFDQLLANKLQYLDFISDYSWYDTYSSHNRLSQEARDFLSTNSKFRFYLRQHTRMMGFTTNFMSLIYCQDIILTLMIREALGIQKPLPVNFPVNEMEYSNSEIGELIGNYEYDDVDDPHIDSLYMRFGFLVNESQGNTDYFRATKMPYTFVNIRNQYIQDTIIFLGSEDDKIIGYRYMGTSNIHHIKISP